MQRKICFSDPVFKDCLRIPGWETEKISLGKISRTLKLFQTERKNQKTNFLLRLNDEICCVIIRCRHCAVIIILLFVVIVIGAVSVTDVSVGHETMRSTIFYRRHTTISLFVNSTLYLLTLWGWQTTERSYFCAWLSVFGLKRLFFPFFIEYFTLSTRFLVIIVKTVEIK